MILMLPATNSALGLHTTKSYQQYARMHCGWQPCQHCYWQHRNRRPRVVNHALPLPRSKRKGSRQTEPWVAAGRLPLWFWEADRCAATGWWALGCHLHGRRVWQDCQLSPQRQRADGLCVGACPPHELRGLKQKLHMIKRVKYSIWTKKN